MHAVPLRLARSRDISTLLCLPRGIVHARSCSPGVDWGSAEEMTDLIRTDRPGQISWEQQTGGCSPCCRLISESSVFCWEPGKWSNGDMPCSPLPTTMPAMEDEAQMPNGNSIMLFRRRRPFQSSCATSLSCSLPNDS